MQYFYVFAHICIYNLMILYTTKRGPLGIPKSPQTRLFTAFYLRIYQLCELPQQKLLLLQ